MSVVVFLFLIYTLVILFILINYPSIYFILKYATRFDFKYNLAIEARKQKDKSVKWVLLYREDIYSKHDNDFVYEPLPSSRTDDFLKDTRFDSFVEVYRTYRRVFKKWKKENLQKKK